MKHAIVGLSNIHITFMLFKRYLQESLWTNTRLINRILMHFSLLLKSVKKGKQIPAVSLIFTPLVLNNNVSYKFSMIN